MSPTALIVGSSFLFHLLAAFLAIRLITVTGHKSAWVLIAIAIIIQCFRRFLFFIDLITGSNFITMQQDTVIAFLISFFSFLGVLWIGRFFSEIQSSKLALQIAKQQLEDARAKTESILAAIGDGITILDPKMRIIYQNNVSRSTFGDHLNENCYRAYKKTDHLCPDCPVNATFNDGRIHTMEIPMPTMSGTAFFENTASPLKNIQNETVAGILTTHNIDHRKIKEKEQEDLITHLNLTLAKVQMLTGLIPMCASCKQIRNMNGEWEQIERYIQARSEAQFSHGLCPECALKLYPEMYNQEPDE